MRAVNAAAQTLRESGAPIREVALVWVRSQNRESGEPEPVGIWASADHAQIEVQDLFTGNVVEREFHPGLLEVGEVIHEAGLDIRPLTLSFSPLETAVQVAFRQHDARGARVQVWLRSYDLETNQPVAGRPEAVFAGYVDEAPLTVPPPGGETAFAVSVVSSTRMLTITSPLRKSDQAQRRRNGDRFRRYKGTASRWDIPWGLE